METEFVAEQLAGWTVLPEAAKALGLSKQGLHFRVSQGRVPEEFVRAVKTGSRKMILIADEYIEKERA